MSPKKKQPPKRRVRARAQPHPEAFAFTIPDAQAMGAPGRTKIYELGKTGRLKFVHVDGRTMITGESLRDLLTGPT